MVVMLSLPQCNSSLYGDNATALVAQGDPTAAGLTMALGILSNVAALLILAENRSRRRPRAAFLLLASALVATDCTGHIVPGALVLSLYSAGQDPAHTDPLCQVLGGCMVFFGLSPLMMGCVMAAERCLGVTRPLLHGALVSTNRVRLCLALVWLSSLALALLPGVGLGAYTYQHPCTWCFIDTSAPAQALTFSLLGLLALAGTLLCNTVSGVTLLRARLCRQTHHPLHPRHPRRGTHNSHDIEMVGQLVGIMVTSCICWSPLLIFTLMTVTGRSPDHERLMVTGVRLATWNQILDPWVYILLRRSVLRRICRLAGRQVDFRSSTLRRWDAGSFQG